MCTDCYHFIINHSDDISLKYEIKIYLSWNFDLGEEEEEVLAEEPEMIFAEDSNNDQSEFDTIVGCIEDIVIGEKFQDLQVSFEIF